MSPTLRGFLVVLIARYRGFLMRLPGMCSFGLTGFFGLQALFSLLLSLLMLLML